MTEIQKVVALAVRGSKVPDWDKREVASKLAVALKVKDVETFVRLASDPHYPA